MTEQQPEIKWFAIDSYVSEDMQNRLSDSRCHFFQRRNTVASQEFVIFSDYLQADGFFFSFFFDAFFKIVLRRWRNCYIEDLEEEHTTLIDPSCLLALTKKQNRKTPNSVHSVGSQVHQTFIYFIVTLSLISFKVLLCEVF